MKRFYSIVLCVLFTAACGLNDKPDTASLGLSAAPSPSASVLACSYTDAYAQLDPDSIRVQNQLLEFSPGVLEHETLLSASTDVVIATVCSIEGGSTYNESKQTTMTPYTYGTLSILKSVKGDLSSGQTIHFTRSGGIVPVDDYLRSLEPAQREAFASAAEKPAYIKQKVDGDIDIEVGKTYLIYLSDDEIYQARSSSYAILGHQGGLRAIRNSENLPVTPETSLSNLEAYQLTTDSWESFNLLFSD